MEVSGVGGGGGGGSEQKQVVQAMESVPDIINDADNLEIAMCSCYFDHICRGFLMAAM